MLEHKLPVDIAAAIPDEEVLPPLLQSPQEVVNQNRSTNSVSERSTTSDVDRQLLELLARFGVEVHRETRKVTRFGCRCFISGHVLTLQCVIRMDEFGLEFPHIHGVYVKDH